MSLFKFLFVAVASLTFWGPLSAQTQKIIHTEKSLYRDIVIYEEAGQRCMRFGRGYIGRQTCMSLVEPDRLVFDYTKMMMGALYLNPEPRRVLIIGLGGGTLPAALAKLYPALHVDAVEIDPAVVRVAERFFGLRPGPRLQLFAEDGRVFVKRALKRGDKYDLVMLDAFDHEYIPEHLLTREFLEEVRGLLNPRGVLAANTFSASRLYDHESATYAAVFGNFFNLRGGNRVILARIGGPPAEPELRRNAALMESRLKPFGAESSTLLPKFSLRRDWPENTRVLTDQFSPSNLLNAR